MRPLQEPHLLPGKNLKEEEAIKDSVAYRRMQGASVIENFRSPDFFVFLFFEKSSGTHSVDFVEYPQNDLQVHISFPGQIHSWNTGMEALGHKLLISRHVIETSLSVTNFNRQSFNKCPIVNVSQTVFSILSQECLAIKEELSYKPVSWEIVILRSQLVAAIVNRLVQESLDEIEDKKTKNSVISEFQYLVEQHFATMHSVSEYAQTLSISPNYLNILCKKYLKKTAKEIIDQRILLEGKRLILGSELTIKEVAFELGFPDLPTFSKYMTLKTGFSPKQFKKVL